MSDDGRGFAPHTRPQNTGLQNMTDRIGALGGSLEIHTGPGSGTTVVASVPLAGSDHAGQASAVRAEATRAARSRA